MKLKFEEIENLLVDGYSFLDGEPKIAFKAIWTLVDKYDLNEFVSPIQKISVYARIAAISCIYSEFSNIITAFHEDGETKELNINFKELIDEADLDFEFGYDDEDDQNIKKCISEYICAIIAHRDNIYEIFSLLDKELGINKTFSLLYYCLNQESLLRESENEDDIYDIVLNIVDPEKLEAFNWLCGYMRNK